MPSEITNEIEEMDDISDVKDEADASTTIVDEAEQSAGAQSSGAEDVSKTADDTLSLVRDVVDDREEAGASSAEAKNGQTPDEEEDTVEPDNENFSDVPFNKHPRFQELLGRVKTAEVDAQRYRNVEQFIDQQGLSGQEAMDMLQIGGLMKTDPVEAWKRALPTIQKLAIAAGEALPDDLRNRVQNGELSREAAMELSRERAANQASQARQAFTESRQQHQQFATQQTAVNQAVETWTAQRQARDPNFDAKMPALQREVAWLQSKEGRPKTPEGVTAQLKKAYDNVSASFSPPSSPEQKPAKKPVMGGQVNGSAQPAPKNTLDIIRAEVAKRNSGAPAH